MNLFNSYKKCFLLVFTFSGILFLSGCGTSQKTNFYQLEDTSESSLLGVEKGHIIGIGPINLPEYLNRPQIVTRLSDYQFNVSEFNRWIEPVDESINRMMVINFSNNMNSNRVYWVPRSDRDYPLDLRIAIDIGRFDGQLGKEIILEARWSIFDKNDSPAITRVSLIKIKVNGTSYNALVIGMNTALEALGKEISEASSAFLAK